MLLRLEWSIDGIIQPDIVLPSNTVPEIGVFTIIQDKLNSYLTKSSVSIDVMLDLSGNNKLSIGITGPNQIEITRTSTLLLVMGFVGNQKKYKQL